MMRFASRSQARTALQALPATHSRGPVSAATRVAEYLSFRGSARLCFSPPDGLFCAADWQAEPATQRVPRQSLGTRKNFTGSERGNEKRIESSRGITGLRPAHP